MLIDKERLPIKEILSVGLLPSPIKKFIYRIRGYRLGSKVSIGIGSVICGDAVSIGDNTKIGFFTIVRGRSITIGSNVSIGAMTFLDTPHLEIGDGSKINEQVFVGGLQYPDSRFVLGKNCQVMQFSFINPAKYITVGDDSGIGGHCLLFGHTSWLSKFEGYPVEFDSIEIGKSVMLSWRVTLLPGAKIGDGAIIGANSLVQRTVPARSMAVGFPARILSKYPEFPQKVSDDDKTIMLRQIVDEMMQYFEGSDLIVKKSGDSYSVGRKYRSFFSSRKDETWSLQVRYDALKEKDTLIDYGKQHVFLSLWRIPPEIRQTLDEKSTAWIDIEAKERTIISNDFVEEIAYYLTRYGVRLLRAAT